MADRQSIRESADPSEGIIERVITMYRYAFRLFRLYWPFILLVSALLFALDIWADGRALRSFFPSLFAYAYLIFYFHATLLKGFRLKLWGKEATKERPHKHFWIAFLFPVLSFVGAIAVFGFLAVYMFPAEELLAKTAFGFALILIFVFWGILLSLFGTMMPAATLGSSVGFAAALNRSRKSFWFVFWRLVVGPVFFSVGFLFLLVLLKIQGLVPPFPETFSGVTVFNAAWFIAIGFIGTFSSALAAAIFSMAYLRVEEGRLPTFVD